MGRLKTNLIHGQSMTKTVTGLTVGALICSGKIESIDDNFGKYSPVLEKTPFANVRLEVHSKCGVELINMIQIVLGTFGGW